MKKYNAYQYFDSEKRIITGSQNIFYSDLELSEIDRKKPAAGFTAFERAEYVGPFVKFEYGFDHTKYINHNLIKIEK